MDLRLVWAAGFVDGEGCVTIQRSKHANDKFAYFQPLLDVAQIQPAPLEVLVELFGGRVALRARGDRNYYFWRLYGSNAVDALKSLLPYLRCKQKQANILIEYDAMGGKQGQWIDEAFYTRRQELWLQIRGLNAGNSARRAERLSEVALREAAGDAIVRSHGKDNRETEAEMTSALKLVG